MATFFFHLHECGTIIEDEEGVEVAGLDRLRRMAIHEARQVMSAEVAEGRLCLGCHIVVENADRQEVLRLPFRDALRVTGL